MRLNNVLVVAAHPDDEVLGVGGTIPIIKAAGGRVSVVIVTDGSSSQYPGDTEVLERKQTHAAEANRLLGTDELLQWDYPDMALDTIGHTELNRAFEEVIGEHGYDAVFVPNLDDINLDHHLIYRSVMVATRPVPEQSVQSVLSYPVNSSTEWGGRTQTTIFTPNVYIDISETLDTKIAAMECYRDELRPFPHPRSIEGIRHRAATYGSEVGHAAAEAFKLLLSHGPLTG